jgi:hypothetical protein
MKFIQAWADIAHENVVLKFCVAALSLTNVVTAFALTNFALKKPLVVERSDVTQILTLSDGTATTAEVEQFLRLALSQRFDTAQALDENWFVAGEVQNRQSEAKEMASRQIRQKVLINKVDVTPGGVTVEADRILEVGTVKTILPFPLLVKMASVDRSPANPYGLKIVAVTNLEKKEVEDGP